MQVKRPFGLPKRPFYGVRIHYAQGQLLNLPDVTLEFVGMRESPASSDYPRSMIFYDFKVYQGDQVQLVSWTAGTGDIGPTVFELAGHRYALDLAISDRLGALEADELVLWREAIPITKSPWPHLSPHRPARLDLGAWHTGFRPVATVPSAAFQKTEEMTSLIGWIVIKWLQKD